MRHRTYHKNKGKGWITFELILLLPILIPLIIGILFAVYSSAYFYLSYDATQQAARLGSILPPIINIESAPYNSTVTCRRSGGGVKCEGASVANSNTFFEIKKVIRKVCKLIDRKDIRVLYYRSNHYDKGSIFITVKLVGGRCITSGSLCASTLGIAQVPATYLFRHESIGIS